MNTVEDIINKKKYISLYDALHILKVSRMTLYRKEMKGDIVAVKYGRNKYYKLESIYKYINDIIL